ncbi:MAG: alanine--tRNA ligase, partial [Oscillospiraceae bacterium]|nr:alanine--tRNA ligase [Oscillospiraceae bacterium]
GISVGDEVNASIDRERRLSIMRNHTCAHLLQAALRNILGDHVHQAGQLVDAERVRFDFSHFDALTADELRRVEHTVNSYIMDAVPVTMTEMPIEEAKKLGAMALFGEKYGDVVRVVEAKGQSVEFCGGTHVDNTAKLGLFRILSESSVASGVRRIEAVTGSNVLSLINEYKDLLVRSSEALKLGNYNELPEKCAAAAAEIKSLEKEKAELSSKLASSELGDILKNTVDVNGVSVATAVLKNTAPDMLRSIGDEIKANNPLTIAVIAADNGKSASILCVCGKDAVAKGAHAGKIVKEVAALTGGKGGGRPDSAMAGAGDVSKLAEALGKAAGIAGNAIK